MRTSKIVCLLQHVVESTYMAVSRLTDANDKMGIPPTFPVRELVAPDPVDVGHNPPPFRT